ncbi:MAG: Ig-like domain-containing protein [Acidobacteria bacterium]|nr:Ig-like domain-containing protein [Acidobacteriota bacterium]
MRYYLGRATCVAQLTLWLIATLSCAHDQQLQSIEVRPAAETFGASNIPVTADAGLSVQLRALGHYIHPPVTKDITSQVAWSSDDVQMVTIDSTGLLTATGNTCGSSLVSATVQTNSDLGGRSSSGAIVTGTMTANVVCFTGSGSNLALTISFLGSGTGTVTVVPSSALCTQTCSLSFSPGAGPITLTAAATSGTFRGWSTNCPPTTDPNVCTIASLTADTTIDATFN